MHYFTEGLLVGSVIMDNIHCSDVAVGVDYNSYS